MDPKQYSAVIDDHFPRYFFAGFTNEPKDADLLAATQAQTMLYEKVTWKLPGTDGLLEEKGLRYGENPGQEAALYRPINGNLMLAGIEFIGPGQSLVGGLQTEALIQFGKHPSKTNLTDVDSGLNIIKFFHEDPCAVIIKHNNPCGVALGFSLSEAYRKAWEADCIAAFGGALIVNRPLDTETAEAIASQYYEVVCAPEYEEGAVEILSRRKNLRVIRLKRIDNLRDSIGERFIDIKSLSDGSLIPQWSYVPTAGRNNTVIRSFTDFAQNVEIPKDIPVRDMDSGKMSRTGETVSIQTQPTREQLRDLWFAWMVETGVTSNSVLTAKDQKTVSIGAGGQDRVSMARLCVSKAFESSRALHAIKRYGVNYDALRGRVRSGDAPPEFLKLVEAETQGSGAGLHGAAAASDAFFPFRDGAEVLLEAGINAIVQPGGSLRDADVVQACNEHGAVMVLTGMRCFRH